MSFIDEIFTKSIQNNDAVLQALFLCSFFGRFKLLHRSICRKKRERERGSERKREGEKEREREIERERERERERDKTMLFEYFEYYNNN